MSKTLLAIDDSATMRKVFEITFGGEDFRVLVAENRDAAMSKLGEGPDVVLIDTTLDGVDGYALCKEIRQKASGAVVLMLSSRFSAYDAAKGKDAGADDNIDKPFDTQAVIDKVRKLILAKEGGTGATSSAGAAAKPASAASSTTAAAKPAEPAKKPEAEPARAPAAAASPAKAPEAERPRPAAAAAAQGPGMQAQLKDLGLNPQQIDAVMALSRDVVERVVWEVVPQLAEALIKEEIARLTR